ncbi:MAG: PDC sensor domain-containing protein [Gammaproteobacteria bacterium]|nr:PDC sensor domain-containing protein [Gammaproteobacteria bacterium]
MKALFSKALVGLTLLALSGFAYADEVKDSLLALAENEVKQWLNTPVVWEQVKAQNSKHQGMSEADIITLDKQWRAETAASDQPLIKKVLGTSLSGYLSEVKEKSAGVYTEIFVMDAIGLNVGQSDVTSDYWQGDEAKWQKTYPIGPDAYHIGDVEMDESSQQLQVQLSLPVVENGTVIGAVTIGINVDAL